MTSIVLVLDQETSSQVVSQVETFFAKENTRRIWNYLDDDGMVPVEAICKFKEMRAILKLKNIRIIPQETMKAVAVALRTSSLTIVSEDGTKVRSIKEKSELEKIKIRHDKKTVVASQFPLGVTDSNIKGYFSEFGQVKSLYTIPSASSVTAIIRFAKKGVAKDILARDTPLSYEDQELILRTKERYDADYLREKEERKRKREEEEAERAERAEREREAVEDYWQVYQVRSTGKDTSGTFSLSDRCYKKMERMKPFRSSLDLSRFKTRFKNPIDLNSPPPPVYINTPIFYLCWTVTRFDYMVCSDIREKKRVSEARQTMLKFHFIDFESGNKRKRGAPKPRPWDPEKTRYIRDLLGEVSGSLHQPAKNAQFLEDRYNKHLSKQNVLTQEEAMEMLLACHEQFNMARLYLDMRGRAYEFAVEEDCDFKQCGENDKNYPKMYRLRACDLVTLVRNLLGPHFFPHITARKVDKKNWVLHEIGIRVNEFGQPVNVIEHKREKEAYINCRPEQWVIF